jgi:hypothetical protein
MKICGLVKVSARDSPHGVEPLGKQVAIDLISHLDLQFPEFIHLVLDLSQFCRHPFQSD